MKSSSLSPCSAGSADPRTGDALNRCLEHLRTPVAATALGPWHPQEFSAECVETIPEAGEMMVFVFSVGWTVPRLAFQSGQYINIDFPVHGPDAEPVSRSYLDLESRPSRTMDVLDHDQTRPQWKLVSRWAHDYLTPALSLRCWARWVHSTFADYDRRARYLLLAAGAGITPLMSMIRTIHSTFPARPMSFSSITDPHRIASLSPRNSLFLAETSIPDRGHLLLG